MIDKNRLAAQLIIDEGDKRLPYKDTVGKLTIGVGRNLTDKGISQAVRDLMLQEDINEAETALVKNLPWYGMLDPVRQEVLCNMCFNMGWGGLSQFKTTLGLIQQGRFQEASVSMMQSKWAAQVGDRAKRLSEKMRTGK